MTQTRPDLVIFDCDGVLVDSEAAGLLLLAQDLAARGLNLSEEEATVAFQGFVMRECGRMAAEMGADIPDDWTEQFYEKLYDRLAQGTDLIKGVPQMLDRLDAAGIPYCVGSNGSLRKMGVTLGQHPDVQKRLEGRLFSAHEVGSAKPDPGLFLTAAYEMGAEPLNCVVIDDSPAGVIAGRLAGMRTFGFAEHDDGARLAAEGGEVAHSMEQIAEALGI